MRIHRIHLRSYRGVDDAEVHFPATGVTIVEGDNEVGKSSIAESIDLLFAHRDTSTHRDVKAVQPVHRDEGPEVEVELTTGPYRLTYAKRWHKQRQTTLTVHEPVREQLTGRPAHDRVQAILEQTLDTGLWDALRLQQGAALTQAHLDVSSLGQALDQAAGGERTGEREDLLWERATAERSRYWSATGKPSSERLSVAAAVNQARADVEEAEVRIRALDDAAEEVGRLVVDAAALEADQAQRVATEAELRARSVVVTEHRQAVDRARLQLERAEVQLQALEGEDRRRGELVDAVLVAERTLAERRAEAEHAQPTHDGASARARAAEMAAAEARTALADAEDRLRLATDDRDDRRRAIEVEQLRERCERVRKAEDRLRSAEVHLEASRVDHTVVHQLEAAHLEVLKAEAAIGADAATVQVTALRDHQLQVDGRAVAVCTDEVLQHTVTGSLHLVLADVARVEVTADASSRALAERLSEARTTFDRLAASAGVADLDEARAEASARSDAERIREQAATAIKENLRDLTLDALADKVDRHQRRLACYAAERADAPPLPVDLTAAQAVLAGVQAEIDAARRRAKDTEEASRRAQAEVASAQVDGAGLTANVQHAESAMRQAREVLLAARGHRTDEAITSELVTARGQVAAARSTVADAEASLATHDPDTLDELLANAVAARERSAAALRQNHERRHHLQGVIVGGGGDGLGQVLDEACTTLAHLEVEHHHLEQRAAAALLLHDALRTRRDEARDRYVAPFRERIEQLGRLVFGPTLQVELNAELDIASRTLHGVTVPYSALSTGAQEQLAILSRLACAAIVSADGGAPVVLDDALGWTDPGRLDGMGAAISVAGRDCQVIVLTCTPGRYASVGQATVVHLQPSRRPPALSEVTTLPLGDPAAA